MDTNMVLFAFEQWTKIHFHAVDMKDMQIKNWL